MVVRKHELLRENFLVDRKDRLVLEVEKNELPLVSEVLKKEHYVQLQVERKELLRHSYLVDRKDR